ncbi:Zn-dependent protease [candidate division WOR-3 bacterium JGI_Cruoil_03_44_89]|uniref:Zn-dependent protease n=1 Tax=candidate division WOR-3 bacterium JGI_Cruoil_03_44_89 TaxID=1973748 RepID=A0A235BNP8_UNCW3|nr:MAG: Zn-dependent protease [candidate division WOR-3 bacterium JGI_Cruoil_03_44_89]
MERLMQIARKVSDKVEIYSLDETSNSVSFENAKLKDIDSKFQSGFSLRIIKDGKVGFAFTKNLIDREEFVENALSSLKGGVEAEFDLPLTGNLPKLDTYDPSIGSLENNTIVDECNRICDILAPRTEGQINLYAGCGINRLRLMNSNGTDLSTDYSYYYTYTAIMYPGSYASISREGIYKKFKKTPDACLKYVLDTYNGSAKEVSPRGGKMKVLFLPETIYVLMWRLWHATSGKSIYQKESPISGKLGKQIFDSKLTIYNDPLNDRWPGARSFDDEGTPCQYFPIVENGVLKNFYYDLHYANKLNTKPTGHGFKSSGWGGDTITLKPNPHLNHLFIKPGDKSLSEIIRSLDRGIIVAGALGAHSGNIPNGDFSIGLCPGLYVENGEIVGYVKDAMVAGNIYEVMKNVVAIEDTLYPASMGTYPAVLFDDVSVATK